MAPRHAVDNDDVPMVERAPHQGPDSVPVLLPAVGVGDGEVLHVGPGQGNTLPLSQPLRETNHLEATCREGCRRDRRRDARQEEGSSFHVVVDQGWDLGGFPPDGCQPIPFAVSRVQAQALRDLQEIARDLSWLCWAPGVHRSGDLADLRILDGHHLVGCCRLPKLLGRRSGGHRSGRGDWQWRGQNPSALLGRRLRRRPCRAGRSHLRRVGRHRQTKLAKLGLGHSPLRSALTGRVAPSACPARLLQHRAHVLP